jgi:hypothetical protein
MQANGAKRLIILTGSMVDDTGDGPFLRYVGKPIARRALKGICTDMLRAEDDVHSSPLDWTIFRRQTWPTGRRQGSSGPPSTAIYDVASGSDGRTWPPACSGRLTTGAR